MYLLHARSHVGDDTHLRAMKIIANNFRHVANICFLQLFIREISVMHVTLLSKLGKSDVKACSSQENACLLAFLYLCLHMCPC